MEKIKNFVKEHKVVSVVAGVVVVALVILAIYLSVKPDSANTDAQKETFKPTFMYFVSKSDESYDEEMAAVQELMKDYEGEIIFDIKDVDEDAEAIKSFPMVEGNTPFLIMLDSSNDLSVFKPGVVDKKEFKKYIKEALKN